MLPYLRWWRPLCVANGITRPCDNTRVPRRGGSRRGAVSGGMLRVHRWGRSERRGCGCRCSRASVLGTRAYVWEQLPRGSQQLCCRMPFPYSGLPELHLARPHRHQLAGRSGGPRASVPERSAVAQLGPLRVCFCNSTALLHSLVAATYSLPPMSDAFHGLRDAKPTLGKTGTALLQVFWADE